MDNKPHDPGAADAAAPVAAFPNSTPPTPGVQETPGDSTALAPLQNDAAAPMPVTATRVQLPALPYGLGLKPRQRVALQALAGGQGPRAAAQLARVTEMTLFRWRRYHPAFIAAWNSWEAESEKTTRDSLVVAREYAARTVLQAAQRGDVRVSLAVLKGLQALAPTQAGPRFGKQVRLRLIDESDKFRRETHGSTSSVREHMAEMKLDQKQAAARRREWFARYLKTPALPRPITPEAIQKSAQDQANAYRMRGDACSVLIMAITGDRGRVAELCVGYCRTDDEPIERRLESLPLLLDHFVRAGFAEQKACELESHGAAVEFRPGWVE